MKKLPVFLLTVLCFFAIRCGICAQGDPTIRIGLLYGANALPSVRFQNMTGSGAGYGFGVFDENGNAISLVATTHTQISVLGNQNYVFANGDFSLATTGGSPVGIAHLQLTQTFDTAQQAEAMKANLPIASFIYYANGRYGLRFNQYISYDAAAAVVPSVQQSFGEHAIEAVAPGKNTFTIASFATGEVLAQVTLLGEKLAVIPQNPTGERPTTWFRQLRYLGNFEVAITGGDKFSVVNVCTLSDYCKGVIPYEISPKWPIEAQKAAALCAKNYALSNLNRHGASGFSLCTTTHCQVYSGCGSATELSDSAVDAVMDKLLVYGDEKVTAFYHACNGGATEDSRNVWGGAVPYLLAVKDDLENIENVAGGIWQRKTTLAELTKILKGKNYDISNLVDIYVDEYTSAGNVYRLTVVDDRGVKKHFEKESARTIFSTFTSSQRYTVTVGGKSAEPNPEDTAIHSLAVQLLERVGAVSGVAVTLPKAPVAAASSATAGDGTVVFSGRGNGHNVGLSQWGAKYKAEIGYTYEDILKFYFSGTEVVDDK